MEFAKRLAEELKAQKITPYQLAKNTGIKKQSLYYYLNEKQEPTISILYKICKYLDVSSDYLLGLNENY